MNVHKFDNLSGQLAILDLGNRMVEDCAQLLQTAVGLRSAGRGLLLLAREVKQGGLRRKTCVVRQSLRLGDSVRIRRVESRARRGVAAKAQRGEGRRGGS